MGGVRVKKTFGKTWVSLENKDLLTPAFMNKLGKFLVASIVLEGRRELSRQRSVKGQPEGLPNTERFFESFSYKIEREQVLVLSDWPWIEQLTQGRPEYKMPWLTQEQGVFVVPMRERGQNKVILRATPSKAADAWVHPGFKKHNFITRGYRKALAKFRREFTKDLLETLRKTPVL